MEMYGIFYAASDIFPRAIVESREIATGLVNTMFLGCEITPVQFDPNNHNAVYAKFVGDAMAKLWLADIEKEKIDADNAVRRKQQRNNPP